MLSPEAERRLYALFEGNITEENLGVEGLKDLCALFAQNIEDPVEKLIVARTFLQAIFENSPDAVENFLDIRIAERCDARPQGTDCFGYLFGLDANAEKTLTDLIIGSKISIDPIVDSLALYVNEELTHPIHIGKVTSEKKVLSKWGLNGHVYEHHPLLVPLSYGWSIAYLSR